MGRRVAFQCMMVLLESNPAFPLILPRYLMAVNFTAFDLPAIYTLNGWLSICTLILIVNTFKLDLFSIALCSMHGASM